MLAGALFSLVAAGAAAAVTTSLATPLDTRIRVSERAVVSDAFQSLDGDAWLVSNGSAPFKGTVPGDLLTDLQRAGVIGDPLFELNFQGNIWDSATFNYTISFTLEAGMATTATQYLVLDGVKMVSDIFVNDVTIGYTADQFLRYEFDVTSALRAGANTLTISFPTGAPYSTTRAAGANTFSKGLWKSVYLVGVASGSAVIEHVAPRVLYKGDYPTAPLTDENHGDFSVDIVVHFIAPTATSGTLNAVGAWGATATLPVTLPAGSSNATITLHANNNAVKLWWPAQTPGSPNLYAVNVSFTEAKGGAVVKADSRRIGFRTFALVTGNDTDPSTLIGRDGQDGFTMRFKVNGANIWSRGGNMIPMEEMEGRSSDAAHRRLVQSAVEGGFNTFRLWGGGIFQWEAWYEACDEFGMLIYHDMMFAQGNHAPAVTPMQTAEIKYQVRRLASHPSVAVWDGCNECNGHGIYADFVMTTVAAEDPARPPWPSCPAHGWASGVDALWGLPNGSPLGMQPKATRSDAHPLTPFYAPPATCKQQRTTDAAAALGCADGDTCSYAANEDYDQGTMGPSFPAKTAAECCALCTAHAVSKACWAATFTGDTCWLKTKNQTAYPIYDSSTTGCWPQGHVPPPPPPPAPLTCGSVGYETHGYYQHGEGYKTVNSGSGKLEPFLLNVPPQLTKAALTGPACPGTYASEFGASVISSFESMSPTLDASHWGLHNLPMAQRNYAQDNFVTAIANTPWPSGFDGVAGETAFKQQLYFSMVSGAVWLKSDIEGRRSANSWGCVLWQYGEIWPTGGWGTVEYGTTGFTPGQVEGGRWKPVQYFLRRYVFRDLLISASSDGRVFIKSDDAFAPFTGSATLYLLNVNSGTTRLLSTYPVTLPRGGGASMWACANSTVDITRANCPAWSTVLPSVGCAPDGSDCIAMLALKDSSGALVGDNFELLAPPYLMTLPAAKVTFAIGSAATDGSISISLTTDKTALFVVLTTLAQGRFSDNVLILTPGTTTVSFIPWANFDAALLASSLRVEHMASYPMNATAWNSPTSAVVA